MAEVGVHEAKTHFSKLLKRVAAGEEIVITRNREVVARLVPPAIEPKPRLVWGTGADAEVWISPDFNDEDPEFNDAYYNGHPDDPLSRT